MTFLALSVALFVAAWASRDDEGAIFGWLGVASAFLTAGLVDLFGLLEGRRRRRLYDQRLVPVRLSVERHLRAVRRDLFASVSSMLPVHGDPGSWVDQLRKIDPRIDPAVTTPNIWPRMSIMARMALLHASILDEMVHLEALSAGGIHADKVAAINSAARAWLLMIEVLAGGTSNASGTSAQAVAMLEPLLAINIPAT